ncbi:MAG: O-antigen ligase family protein, partial [Gemmatimonadetes bacterium]|nr:O-antigen ligase family protein [Gemmatimonadota bacterium]
MTGSVQALPRPARRFAPSAAVLPWTVSALLLWGAFTLRVPALLALGYLACVVGILERLLVHFRMHPVGLLVLANYATWVVSGLATGGVAWDDFLSPAFFNNDGRAFLYYLPLLFFTCCTARARDLSVAARTATTVAVVGVVLMLPWAIAAPSWLSVGSKAWYGGLLTSHTGAGTFFGVLAAWLLAFGDASNARRHRLIGLACTLPMFASGSRQALVSLLAVFLWYAVRTGRRIVLVRMVAVAVGLVGLLSVAVPQLVQRTAVLASPETYGAIADIAERANWEPSVGEPLGGVESNILSRIVLWKYAARRFSESPLLGIGFARYNDQGVRTRDAGVGAFAVEGDRLTNVYNAHNMYLHVLAENGLFGLVLLGALWGLLWWEMVLGGRKGTPATRPYFVACQAALVFTAVSACFDNALASPSLGLPLFALVGLGLAHRGTQANGG